MTISYPHVGLARKALSLTHDHRQGHNARLARRGASQHHRALLACSPLTLTLSPLRGEGIGGASLQFKLRDNRDGASTSPLNGERAGVRGEAGVLPPDASA